MGLFDFFSNKIVAVAVDRIILGIKATDSYKYFAKDDSSIIKEYKDFECSLIASTIAVIALDMNLSDDSQRKDIQTIYIRKCSGFLRKIISEEYQSNNFYIDKGKADIFFKGSIEKMVVFETHERFEKYLKDIRNAFNDNSAEFFLKYREPKIVEWSGETKYGEQRVFEFLCRVLLAEESFSWDSNYADDKMQISYKPISDLNDSEFQQLHKFVSELKELQTK
jgi:hypothetical protein